MSKPYDCSRCGKFFRSKRATANHIRDVHKGVGEARKRPKPPKMDSEKSLADISVDAHLKRAMGEPLDPLEESLIFD